LELGKKQAKVANVNVDWFVNCPLALMGVFAKFGG
jgi:hypothetical protein